MTWQRGRNIDGRKQGLGDFLPKGKKEYHSEHNWEIRTRTFFHPYKTEGQISGYQCSLGCDTTVWVSHWGSSLTIFSMNRKVNNLRVEG